MSAIVGKESKSNVLVRKLYQISKEEEDGRDGTCLYVDSGNFAFVGSSIFIHLRVA